MNDQDVYQRIGSMLLGAWPPEAARIVLRAEMSESGGHFSPAVEWLDPAGATSKADADGIPADLYIAFLELRALTVGQGKEPWSTWLFTLDAASGKFDVSFGYER